MITLRLILMILALVCFFLSAVGVSAPRGGNLIAGGLGLWALATMITV